MEPQTNLLQVQICPNPIFIFGAPRSGSHILAHSLAEHSHLWTQGESGILNWLFGDGRVEKLYEREQERQLPTWLRVYGVEKAELLSALGVGLNALFTSRGAGKRWIDKTPGYAMIGPLLAEMFPGAYFLHILRDGRRVVHSMTHLADRFGDDIKADMIKRGLVTPVVTDFRELCKRWRWSVETAMEFCGQHPTRCLTVVNEQLVADPDKVLSEIFQFIRAPFEAAPLHYYRTHRIHSSFKQATAEPSPIEDLLNPRDEWNPDQAKDVLTKLLVEEVGYKLSEPWQEWTPQQKKIFWEEAGGTLVKYGLTTRDELDDWGDAQIDTDAGISGDGGRATSAGSSYLRLIDQIQTSVRDARVPPEARVLVISKGDDELLKLVGRRAAHFPQSMGGAYAGHHPASSEEAITHLEELRGRGAEYLLIPHTSLWWLEHYAEFGAHLDTRYERIVADEHCVIYKLS